MSVWVGFTKLLHDCGKMFPKSLHLVAFWVLKNTIWYELIQVLFRSVVVGYLVCRQKSEGLLIGF